ncbi:unnamed protein product [Brassicogethes aeneus]|uniref:Uncharacterized protein n=1 Tax=Brassicogethes aeneus TaxID=1431903 RepID=A0A9P0F8Q8_BRAAE|nr:unnamed protein product [Brassicogethes aeneus]
MYLDFYISAFSPKDELYINKVMSHLCIFLILLSISMVPMLILTMKELYSRSIPDFLLWVGEDPWLRSEIGTSGHYLERPVRVAILKQNKNSAFRSRRSSSVDWIIPEPNYNKLRLVKSLTTMSNNEAM